MRPRHQPARHPAPAFGRAAAAALAGAVPALLIATSARAASATPADDWAMGLLALAFGSALFGLALVAQRLTSSLRDGARASRRETL